MKRTEDSLPVSLPLALEFGDAGSQERVDLGITSGVPISESVIADFLAVRVFDVVVGLSPDG